MIASCISTGIPSSVSSFALPFDLGGTGACPTREFNGARTKEVSAMKEGSLWSGIATN